MNFFYFLFGAVRLVLFFFFTFWILYQYISISLPTIYITSYQYISTSLPTNIYITSYQYIYHFLSIYIYITSYISLNSYQYIYNNDLPIYIYITSPIHPIYIWWIPPFSLFFFSSFDWILILQNFFLENRIFERGEQLFASNIVIGWISNNKRPFMGNAQFNCSSKFDEICISKSERGFHKFFFFGHF